ncbi:MAG: 30S ribosomal protein S9 [Candidatus Micrarchaeia archaeon]
MAEEQQAPVQEEKPLQQKAKKKVKKKVVTAHARRKEARARARLVPGSGRLTINGKDVNAIENKYLRAIVLEPINLSKITKEIAKSSDIEVSVRGGGISGQMQAARSAIAKVIVNASKDEVVKKIYATYDRSLIIDDVRQVEPKKFKGPKARARFQKSYR